MHVFGSISRFLCMCICVNGAPPRALSLSFSLFSNHPKAFHFNCNDANDVGESIAKLLNSDHWLALYEYCVS